MQLRNFIVKVVTYFTVRAKSGQRAFERAVELMDRDFYPDYPPEYTSGFVVERVFLEKRKEPRTRVSLPIKLFKKKIKKGD